MQQSASTSATLPFGELAIIGLVHPGLSHTSTAVSLGDVASPVRAVQAGAVARTSIVPQPPRIHTLTRRAPSILPDVLANPEWQPTNSAAPVLPPFTTQPGIQVETANLPTLLDFFGAVFHRRSVCIDFGSKQFICSTIYRRQPRFKPCQTIRMETHYGFRMLIFFRPNPQHGHY
ncbi:unnamed protein product [Staurois parvus]|uniref:Uncharacterized protein n=1 Tax=Staurois parvus TaxID=386267 RepID=A0ABN9G5A9_9NEOB|nr:unnamed protein product [Staurois parvus]